MEWLRVPTPLVSFLNSLSPTPNSLSYFSLLVNNINLIPWNKMLTSVEVTSFVSGCPRKASWCYGERAFKGS